MYLFGDKALEREVQKLRDSRDELEKTTSQLKQEKEDLVLSVEKLKQQKKIEEEDIKHMIKMRDEKALLEKERYQVQMQSEKDKAIAAVKDEYRDKMEKQLAEETKNIKAMYDQILKRLPNVNVKMSGAV